MKIKICGITNYDDANQCVELGADAIGFIFYKRSKRYVKPDIVENIINQLPPFIMKVGVFVNEDPNFINKIAGKIKLNMVQLHGDETPDYVNKINLPIIKAFRINEEFNFEKLKEYKRCSFLFDSFDNKKYGGTGIKFNWEKIPNDLKSKIILAGGVSLDNLEHINNNIMPYGIDISSSVEISPGKKDHNKLNQIFEKLDELRNRKC